MSANRHKAGQRRAVSVTQIGKYTVVIYDQDAYDAAIARYDSAPAEPAPAKKFVRQPFIKRKRIAAYGWVPAPEALKGDKGMAS
jgi:hypothetical protein